MVLGVPAEKPAVFVPVRVRAKSAPALSGLLLLVKPLLRLRCAEDKALTSTLWLPTAADVDAVTLTADELLLDALTELKLSLSLTALSVFLSSAIMNITAERPLTLLSFLVILALMALACGARSASTKFCANEATSTPEPALREEMIFCALALFAAATCAAEVVLAPVVEVVLVEETAVVAMIFMLQISRSAQTLKS